MTEEAESKRLERTALVSKIICMILKIDQDLLLTVQTLFVYLLR